MRVASDFLVSKTTLFALGTIFLALADAAMKGALSWQQGLAIVLAGLGMTIRDTLAKSQEATSVQVAVMNRALGAAAGASQATKELADAMTGMVAAATPKDAKPGWEHPTMTAMEPDGEADRIEEPR